MIRSTGIPENGLDATFKILKNIYPEIKKSEMTEELTDFAKKWKTLKLDLAEFTNDANSVEENDSDWEAFDDSLLPNDDEAGHEVLDDTPRKKKPCKEAKCQECPACCFAVLYKYRLYSRSYKNIFLAYKYILTLSITQVSCERSFSTLKYVFNRLRSTLTQEHLEAFMIMCCEKQVLYSLKIEEILEFTTE